jgi:hypothetical protein
MSEKAALGKVVLLFSNVAITEIQQNQERYGYSYSSCEIKLNIRFLDYESMAFVTDNFDIGKPCSLVIFQKDD